MALARSVRARLVVWSGYSAEAGRPLAPGTARAKYPTL